LEVARKTLDERGWLERLICEGPDCRYMGYANELGESFKASIRYGASTPSAHYGGGARTPGC
jgi:hypothetical protein